MAYSDQTEYPRGLTRSDLTSDWTPFAAGTTVRVSSIMFTNSSGSELFTMRDADDNFIGSFQVLTGRTFSIGPFFSDNGLKFDSISSARFVNIIYYDD